MHLKKGILSGLILIQLGLYAPATPYMEYEREITDILKQRIPEEEIVELATAGREFLTLYRKPATANIRGAAIIAHPMGAHPDWPEVISPLRTRLPEAGWATLSIQMPVMPPGSPLSDYGGTIRESGYRFSAAIRYLKQNQYINIIIIGYGFGAAIGADFLAHNPGHQVDAFIGISMQSHDFLNPRLRLLGDLEVIDIPMLDVYAGRDRGKVLRQIDDRRLAGGKNGRHVYNQVVIEGVDHFYTGAEQEMIDQICTWLEINIPNVIVKTYMEHDTDEVVETGEISDE